jgi:hypothetical protein
VGQPWTETTLRAARAALAARSGTQAQAAQRRLVQTSETGCCHGAANVRDGCRGRWQPSGTRGGASTLLRSAYQPIIDLTIVLVCAPGRAIMEDLLARCG